MTDPFGAQASSSPSDSSSPKQASSTPTSTRNHSQDMDIDTEGDGSEEEEEEDDERDGGEEEEEEGDEEQEAVWLDTTSSRESPGELRTNGDTTVDSFGDDAVDNKQNQTRSSTPTEGHITQEQSMQRSSEDRELDNAPSDSEEDDNRDADSDEEQQESPKTPNSGISKNLPRRRLRSSKLLVPLALAVDGADGDMANLLNQFSDEQQFLKTSISAAEALSRLFQHGMQDPDGLQSDILDTHDYELIRHTFGGMGR